MFNLPSSTVVNRSIPKNSFDSLISTKLKKLLSDSVIRIRWSNKLSSDTINLLGNEIEIFELQLKHKEGLSSVLDIIDKSIPYSIIFVVSYESETLLTVSKKHAHPNNDNQAVVDFRFSTDWLKSTEFNYELNLKKNLDYVFSDICLQITDREPNHDINIDDLVNQEQKIKQLIFKIDRLNGKIKNCKQFNKKVDFNIELKGLEQELEIIS